MRLFQYENQVSYPERNHGKNIVIAFIYLNCIVQYDAKVANNKLLTKLIYFKNHS